MKTFGEHRSRTPMIPPMMKKIERLESTTTNSIIQKHWYKITKTSISQQTLVFSRKKQEECVTNVGTNKKERKGNPEMESIDEEDLSVKVTTIKHSIVRGWPSTVVKVTVGKVTVGKVTVGKVGKVR
jgi:hypothetical protein